MAADGITLIAPGKVNLFLGVGDRRPDGYHDVVTVLQALDDRVADTIEMSPGDVLAVRCEPSLDLPAEQNLAYRALVRLGEEAGLEPTFDVTITKRVPAGGGLGGASSDAAAVLLGACRFWGLDPASAEITGIAASLGADVPFFLVGGTALYAGRGDELLRRLPTRMLDLVVVNPGVAVSTPAAYATFDRLLRPPVPDVSALVSALSSGDTEAIAAVLFNNLAEAACDVAPEVAEALSVVSQTEGVLRSLVSGSGASVFGICQNAATAVHAAAVAEEREGWWASATCASPGGTSVVG